MLRQVSIAIRVGVGPAVVRDRRADAVVDRHGVDDSLRPAVRSGGDYAQTFSNPQPIGLRLIEREDEVVDRRALTLTTGPISTKSVSAREHAALLDHDRVVDVRVVRARGLGERESGPRLDAEEEIEEAVRKDDVVVDCEDVVVALEVLLEQPVEEQVLRRRLDNVSAVTALQLSLRGLLAERDPALGTSTTAVAASVAVTCSAVFGLSAR